MAAATQTAKKSRKLQLFVDEYLIDFNATRAAIAAGYAKNSAHVTGSRLSKDPWVKAEIRRELAARRKRLKVTADRVEDELAKIGFANLFDYVDRDGSINLGKINRDQAAAVLEVKVSKLQIDMAGPELPVDGSGLSGPDGPSGAAPLVPPATITTTKLKLHSKIPALELLGKRHKMFTDKVEHSGKVTVVVDL